MKYIDLKRVAEMLRWLARHRTVLTPVQTEYVIQIMEENSINYLKGEENMHTLIFRWKNHYSQNDICVDSDRLYEWDAEKYNKCCREVFGDESQYFDNRSPSDIEKFLRLYFGKPIKLTAIKENENAANGYPYWSFYYTEDKT